MGLLQKELSMSENRLFELLSVKAAPVVIKQLTLRMMIIQIDFGGLNIFSATSLFDFIFYFFETIFRKDILYIYSWSFTLSVNPFESRIYLLLLRIQNDT